MSHTLRADYAGMESDRSVLAGVGRAVTGTAMPTRQRADDAAAAAGEFEVELADGAATFALSWWSVLGFLGESADLLADNLGSAVLVLTDVDSALGSALAPGE